MKREVTTTITEYLCDLCGRRMHIVKKCVICHRECCNTCADMDYRAMDNLCSACRTVAHKFRPDFDAIETRRDKDRAAVIEKWREAVKDN